MVTTADAGEYSMLALNSEGLVWLNSDEGGTVILSGTSMGVAFAYSFCQTTVAAMNMATAGTPEPASALLLGTDLLGVFGLRRKFRV